MIINIISLAVLAGLLFYSRYERNECKLDNEKMKELLKDLEDKNKRWESEIFF